MAICAGVQNVSRPMERCQAMSQCVPTMAEVTASTAHQTYHGTADSRTLVIVLQRRGRLADYFLGAVVAAFFEPPGDFAARKPAFWASASAMNLPCFVLP